MGLKPTETMHIRSVTARDGERDRVMDLYVAEGKSMDRIVPMKSSPKALRPARTGLRPCALRHLLLQQLWGTQPQRQCQILNCSAENKSKRSSTCSVRAQLHLSPCSSHTALDSLVPLLIVWLVVGKQEDQTCSTPSEPLSLIHI